MKPFFKNNFKSVKRFTVFITYDCSDRQFALEVIGYKGTILSYILRRGCSSDGRALA